MIKKQCSHCKQIKPVSEFSKDKYKKDGLDIYCKLCRSKKRKTYSLSPRGKATRRHWQQTEKAKTSQKRRSRKYRQSKKGKALHKKNRRKYEQSERRHPEKARARSITSHAIAAGKIDFAKNHKCTYCEKPAEQYHHPDYSKPLNVEPVCRSCHRILH